MAEDIHMKNIFNERKATPPWNKMLVQDKRANIVNLLEYLSAKHSQVFKVLVTLLTNVIVKEVNPQSSLVTEQLPDYET